MKWTPELITRIQHLFPKQRGNVEIGFPFPTLSRRSKSANFTPSENVDAKID